MERFAFLVLLLAACSSGTDDGPREARWEIDEAENLAVPTCAECGEVLDRTRTDCGNCGTAFVIAAKTIDCPECKGSCTCVHCGSGARCLHCDGSGDCVVCEGSGTLDGAVCSECKGTKTCSACAEPGACERCNRTQACANCDGSGSITLR